MNRFFRPLLACASVIALAGCSAGTYTPPAGAKPAPAAHPVQSAAGLMAMADRMKARGDYDAAIPLYRHLAATSGDPAALLALAEGLSAQGVQTEAAAVLSLLKDRGQLTGPGHYMLGKTLLAQGRYAEALSAFDGAWALMPGDARARSGRGVALAALGRTDESVAVLGGGADATSLSNMALVLAANDDPVSAVGILEPLVKSGRTGVQGRQNLAMAYLLAGREREAFQMARLDLDPATVGETFTFYRSLSSLGAAHRMQALVTGTVDPAWTADEAGNLTVADSGDRRDAATRLVEAPVTVAAATPAPETVPETVAAATVDRSNYVLTEIPPMLEPEGWALQIAAYRTVEELMRGWTILYRRSGDLLEQVPPRRSEVDFGATGKNPHGFYYRLNAGPLKSLKAARDLCSALKERGTDCWIRPPEKTEGKLPEKTATPKGTVTATADNPG